MTTAADVMNQIDAAVGQAPPIPPDQLDPTTGNAARVMSAIDQAGQNAAKPDPGFTLAKPGQASNVNPAAGMGMSMVDALTAGAQGTSPVVSGIGGKGNYKLASDKDQAIFNEAGTVPNQQTQVALRDPGTGKYAVYERNPEMAESAPTSIGRLLAFGQPETGIPAVAGGAVPSASQNLLQDFTKAGVSPSIPAVGQGIGSRLTANILSKIPFFGGPVASASQKAMGQTGEAAGSMAGLYGTAANAEEGGRALQSGITQFGKGEAPAGMTASDVIAQPTRESSFPSKAAALYDNFWSGVDQNQQVPLTNTLAALKGPMESFPSSPQLGAALTNPKLQQLYQAANANGGTLSLGEVKNFRTRMGIMMGEPTSLVDNLPRADLKNVYGGLTEDLKAPAAAAGPDVLSAFNRATQYYKGGMDRIDQLDPLLQGSPEQSFAAINRAAGTGSAADAGLLRTLQKSIPADQWGDVGSAVIKKLGEPTAGAKDIAHGNFSASSFMTNWNKLSDAAKDTLFGANAPGSTREGLESLANVANAQKNVAKFANPSGSGTHMIGASLGGLAAEHFFDLSSHPIETMLGLLGGYGASKALMSPGFARWLYAMPNMMAQAPTPMVGMQRALGSLQQMSRLNPNLAPVAQHLNAAVAQQAPGQSPALPLVQ